MKALQPIGRAALFAISVACLSSAACAANTPVALPEPVILAPQAPNRSFSTSTVRTVLVTMTLSGQQLWKGALNIGAGQMAQINLSEPMAGAEGCEQSSLGRTMRRIEITISDARYRREQEGYALNARYSRPIGDVCKGGTGSVSIQQRFELGDARPMRFEGDGGFVVTIAPL